MEKSSARPGIVSRKKRFLRTVLFLIVLLIVLLSLSVALLSVNMRPAMAALAIARIRSVAARAMNDAILESMGDETNYARLIQVHESSERVYMLQANTHKMNILAADCAEAAQERRQQYQRREDGGNDPAHRLAAFFRRQHSRRQPRQCCPCHHFPPFVPNSFALCSGAMTFIIYRSLPQRKRHSPFCALLMRSNSVSSICSILVKNCFSVVPGLKKN